MSITFWRTGVENDAFELNLANSNAYAMLEILQLPVDSYGDMDDLPKVMSRLNYLLNVEQARSELETPTVRDGNFIHCGRNHEYVERRLNAMRDLVKAAQESGQQVVWG